MIDFYKEMRAMEGRVVEEIKTLFKKAGVTQVDFPSSYDDALYSELVSVCVFNHYDGGADATVIKSVIYDNDTIYVKDEDDTKVNISEMTDCSVIYLYEAVYNKLTDMVGDEYENTSFDVTFVVKTNVPVIRKKGEMTEEEMEKIIEMAVEQMLRNPSDYLTIENYEDMCEYKEM